MICADCFHEEANHQGAVCSGSITCMCETFKTPFLAAFAQEIEKVKAEYRSTQKRCEYILEKIPPLRNAGEKAFAKAYKEIWYGFKIRKNGTKITIDEWKRMPHDDLINRAKRLAKEDRPELKTFDKKVMIHQTAIYQALMEMAIEN